MSRKVIATIGEVVNGWTILENLGVVKGRWCVRAQCHCGKEKVIHYSKIRGGFTKSCGCGCNAHLTKVGGELTQKRLHELLTYDKDTGYFTWLVMLSNKAKVGQIAGCIDGDGYVVIGIGGRNYKASTLAWFYVYGEWPRLQLDHINRIRNDNRLSNLREATLSQQQMNKNRPAHNTSGHMWVSADKERGGWRVHSRIFGFVGRFKTKEEAVRAVQEQRKRIQEKRDEYGR